MRKKGLWRLSLFLIGVGWWLAGFLTVGQTAWAAAPNPAEVTDNQTGKETSGNGEEAALPDAAQGEKANDVAGGDTAGTGNTQEGGNAAENAVSGAGQDEKKQTGIQKDEGTDKVKDPVKSADDSVKNNSQEKDTETEEIKQGQEALARYLQEEGYVNAQILQEELAEVTDIFEEKLAAQDRTGQIEKLEKQQSGAEQELKKQVEELEKRQGSMKYAAIMSVIAVLLGVTATIYAQLSWAVLRKSLRKGDTAGREDTEPQDAEAAQPLEKGNAHVQQPVGREEVQRMVQEEAKRLFQHQQKQMVPILCEDTEMRAFIQDCIKKEWEQMGGRRQTEERRQTEPKVETFRFPVVGDKPAPKAVPHVRTGMESKQEAPTAAAPKRQAIKYIVAGKDLTGNNELRMEEKPGQLVITLFSDNTVQMQEEANRGKAIQGMNFFNLGLFDLFEVVADGSICIVPADIDANRYYEFKETVLPAEVETDGRKVRVLKKGRVKFAGVAIS